jgi:4-amino-4-deoxy-L-arabinose transferase-like glycosyltransferase
VVLPPPQDDGRLTGSAEWRKALLVALAGGMIRLLVAALTPLFPDETYYWEWSRHLSAGYFDHPPLIAWTIRAGTLPFGDTVLGVRLGPVLAGIVATLFLAAAARRIAGDRAAFVAALVFSVLPLSAAGLVLATPDAPLLAAASAIVYFVVRALESAPRSRDSLRWWSIAGVALGLALCAKYTAVLIPFGLVVAFAIRRPLRVRLAEPGPYVAVLVALLVFSPVILWNARHDWVSFAFQLQHGLGRVRGSAINRELELVGGQMGLVTPILFVMLVIATYRAIRRPVSAVQPALALLATVIFAFFMYSATKRRAEANWPALAYVPALLLLVAHDGTTRWKRWLHGGIGLAAALTVVTYVNAFTPVLPVPARRDPAARAHGWADLARAVESVHVTRRPISSYRTWIAADRYQDASELAFLLPGQPETFSLNLSGRANHYDLWPAFTDRAQPRDALILVVDAVEGVHPTVALLAPHFQRVTPGDVITLARDGDPVKHMRMWVLDGWFGTWPEGRLRSRS